MNPIRTDVLVVGAGPAGSVAAYQLAGSGIETLLVDRTTFPRDKVCGESFSPGALARLRAIGMWPSVSKSTPVEGEAATATHSIVGMKIRSPSGTMFEGHYRSSDGGTGLAARRLDFDADLVRQTKSRGVKVMESVEAIRPETLTNGTAIVHARFRGTTNEFQIHAKRVIVADGRRSFLARTLGFLEPSRSSEHATRFAVRAHFQGLQGLTNLAEMHVGHRGYCGIAPLSPTTANVCYVRFGRRLTMRPDALEENFLGEIARYPEIAKRFETAALSGPVRVVGPLRLSSRRQTTGPFLACGDATGFLDPFTGEGIAHAIASGVLGAGAITRSLRGDPSSLRAYERQIRTLRRVKGAAALAVHALVTSPVLANAAALVFSRTPGLGDLAVRLFGDQI